MVRIVLKTFNTVHAQDGAGGGNGDLGSSTKKSKNEETQSVKCTYNNKNNWKCESLYVEPPESEAGSDEAPDDADFSFPGENVTSEV